MKISWMTNYNFVCFMAHSEGALLLTLVPFLLFGPTAWSAMTIAVLIAAGIKEFWFDMRYEDPPQTFNDSLLDFAGYAIGQLVSLGLMILVTRLGLR
jgi:hypothetical protein